MEMKKNSHFFYNKEMFECPVAETVSKQQQQKHYPVIMFSRKAGPASNGASRNED